MPDAPIRPWRLTDADSIVVHANNVNVSRHLRDRFPSPYFRSHAEEWILRATSHVPVVDFAITADGEAVGAIGLELGSDIHRYTAEVGYWLGETYWGRGFMTAALREITDYAFQELGLIRVFALPFVENAASIRVLEKAGYVREGRLSRAAFKEGRVRDMFLYAVTREHTPQEGDNGFNRTRPSPR